MMMKTKLLTFCLTLLLVTGLNSVHGQETSTTNDQEHLTFEKWLYFQSVPNPFFTQSLLFSTTEEKALARLSFVIPKEDSKNVWDIQDFISNNLQLTEWVLPNLEYKAPVSKMYYLDHKARKFYTNILGMKILTD